MTVRVRMMMVLADLLMVIPGCQSPQCVKKKKNESSAQKPFNAGFSLEIQCNALQCTILLCMPSPTLPSSSSSSPSKSSSCVSEPKWLHTLLKQTHHCRRSIERIALLLHFCTAHNAAHTGCTLLHTAASLLLHCTQCCTLAASHWFTLTAHIGIFNTKHYFTLQTTHITNSNIAHITHLQRSVEPIALCSVRRQDRSPFE